MSHILATSDRVEYPYSFWQLRQDNPNLSFPASLTAKELMAFNVYPVTPSPRPADSRELRAVETQPTLTKAGWVQTWGVREATEDEISAWDAANAPAPDWMGFGIELASSPAIATLFEAIPGPISNALSIGLSEASKGDSRLFLGLWARLLAAGVITAELLGAMGALAQQFNLPAEFTNALTLGRPD